jgi:hypothetical protein
MEGTSRVTILIGQIAADHQFNSSSFQIDHFIDSQNRSTLKVTMYNRRNIIGLVVYKAMGENSGLENGVCQWYNVCLCMLDHFKRDKSDQLEYVRTNNSRGDIAPYTTKCEFCSKYIVYMTATRDRR